MLGNLLVCFEQAEVAADLLALDVHDEGSAVLSLEDPVPEVLKGCASIVSHALPRVVHDATRLLSIHRA